VSVNAIPVSGETLGLVIVNVKLVVPPCGMLDTPNASAMEGGPTTVSTAVDVLPAPPLADVTATLFIFTPGVEPVTLTATVQAPPAIPNDPPDKDTDRDPAFAVNAPPQEPLTPLGVATINPAGKGSVKLTPVRATVLAAGFDRVKLRTVDWPIMIEETPNDLAMTGGATVATGVTVTNAMDVLPVP
jgi:hypothetical protein